MRQPRNTMNIVPNAVSNSELESDVQATVNAIVMPSHVVGIGCLESDPLR